MPVPGESRGAGASRPRPPAGAPLFPRRGLNRRGRGRCLKFSLVTLAWFCVVVLRLLDLQVLQSRELSARALRQQEATVDIAARRGGILDRRGRQFALSTPAESIGVFSDRAGDRRALAAMLAEAVSVDAKQLYLRLQRGGFQWVKRLVTLGEARRARGLGLDILHFETESKRYYPHGTVAAHVLGTVGLDHHGQAGIEQRFEPRLRGEPGLGVFHYDARQRRYGRQALRPSVPGDDVILELDLDIQSVAHMELERAVKETKSQAGTVVLMRPRSGEVVAMASWPRFDPNHLTRTEAELENRRNFAISHLVEPGSTFKVLTAAAALEEGAVTPEDEFDCQMGSIWIDRRRIRDHHPYGMLTMPEVLMKSSNVGIIKMGVRLGSDDLHRYIRRFGFGSPTGVRLPSETPGLVRPLSRWSGASLASLSMGQEVGVSALQMARLFAAIANGGSLVPPRVVRGVRRPGGAEQVFAHGESARVISADTAATMQAILEQVVERGTGRLASIPGYRVAGKTGTAQMINPVSRSYADGAYMASFCGFAPVNDPALVGVAMLYDPRGQHYYGGRIAAPLFASVMELALRRLDVPPSKVYPTEPGPARRVPETLVADFVNGRPDDPAGEEFLGPAWARPPDRPAALAAVPKGAPRRAAPDVRGLTMRDAFSLAARLGIEVVSSGSGMARLQSPAPGESIGAGQVLRIQFASSLAGADDALRGAGGGGR